MASQRRRVRRSALRASFTTSCTRGSARGSRRRDAATARLARLTSGSSSTTSMLVTPEPPRRERGRGGARGGRECAQPARARELERSAARGLDDRLLEPIGAQLEGTAPLHEEHGGAAPHAEVNDGAGGGRPPERRAAQPPPRRTWPRQGEDGEPRRGERSRAGARPGGRIRHEGAGGEGQEEVQRRSQRQRALEPQGGNREEARPERAPD